MSSERESNSLTVFDPNGDPSSLAQRWICWKRSFKIHITAKGITEDKQKKGFATRQGRFRSTRYLLHIS